MMGPISPSEVSKLYSEALTKLTFNSRPVIMSLTEMAHEYASQHSDVIVNVITDHVKKARREVKLPALYLIDSIVKNHPDRYRQSFQKSIVSIFSHVFAHNPDVNVRAALYKLRNTWAEVFDSQKLIQLDVKVRDELDPKWPVQEDPNAATTTANIHINPAVFARKALDGGKLAEETRIEEELKRKRMELMRLENQKLEMQIAAKKRELEENNDRTFAKSASSSNNTTKVPARKVVISPSSEASTTKPILPTSNAPEGAVSTTTAASTKRLPSRDPRTRTSDSSLKTSTANTTTTSTSTTSKRTTSSSSSSKSSGKRRGSSETSSAEKGSKRSKNDEDGSKGSSKSFRIPKVKSGSKESEKRRVSFGDALNKATRSKGTKRLGLKKAAGNENSTNKKRAKFNNDLFGDEDDDVQEIPPSSQGWAKFKERNPDAFRTPMPSSSTSSKTARHPVDQPNPAVFDLTPKPRPAWSSQLSNVSSSSESSNPNYLGLLLQQQVAGIDPGCIVEKVIPDILAQSQASLQMGSITQEQFKDIIHQVVQLKERAMISQADQIQLQTPQEQPQVSQELLQGTQQQHLDPPQEPQVSQHQLPGPPHQVQNPQQPQLQGPQLHGPAPHQQQLQGPQQPHVPGPMAQHSSMIPHAMRPPMGGPRGSRPHFDRRGGLLPRPPLPGGPPGRPALPPFGAAGPKPIHRDLAFAKADELAAIERDTVKSIQIDNEMREIRFYSEIAVCVMSSNEIREVSFRQDEAHPTRLVHFKSAVFNETNNTFNEGNIISSVEINFLEYTSFSLENTVHRLKIGAPTRELFLDENNWLECFFDTTIGPLMIGNTHCFVSLSGPCPEVCIGDLRPDLCAGYVQIIPDGSVNLQQRLYLDSKPQRLDLENKPHVLRFVEDRKILLINDHPFVAEFGGIPKVVYVNGNRHYLRLSSLPEAYVMPVQEDQDGQPQQDADDDSEVTIVEDQSKTTTTSTTATATTTTTTTTTTTREDPTSPSTASSTSLDRILNMLPQTSKKESVADSIDTASESEYKLEQPANQKSKPSDNQEVNVHDLFSQLLGAGLVSKPSKTAIPGLALNRSESQNTESEKALAKTKEEEQKVKEDDDDLKEDEKPKNIEVVLESHHPSLRIRNLSAISDLYEARSLQCKTCGLRFQSTQVLLYSHHLDWHYRINARAKRNAKRPQSRSWFLEASQWVSSDDIVEEEKNEESNTNEPVPTVTMGEDVEGVCAVCNEPIEQFYDQDEEVWKFRNAVRIEQRLFHPQCKNDLDANESFENNECEDHNESVAKNESMENDESLANKSLKEEGVSKEENVVKEEAMDVSEQSELKDEEGIEETVKTETKEEVVVKMEMDKNHEDHLNEEQTSSSLSMTDQSSQESKAEQELEHSEDQVVETVAVKKETIDESKEQDVDDPQEMEEGDVKKELEEIKKEDVESNEEITTTETESEVISTTLDSSLERDESSTPRDLELDSEPKAEEDVSTPVVEELAPILSTLSTTSVVKKADIKLNLTSNIGSPKGKEEESEESETKPIQSEFDPEAIVQEKSVIVVKEKMEGKEFTVMPPQNKDAGVSGLCIVM